MTRPEQLDAQVAVADDPVDALVTLAGETGAHALATSARHIAERLRAARLFVSMIAEPPRLATFLECLAGRGHAPSIPVDGSPAWIATARGVRFGIGTPATCWPPGRVDVVVVDEPHARRISRADTVRHAQTYVVDARRHDEVVNTLELIDRIATEVGADRIAGQLDTQLRDVCRQLWSHLAEQQRALGLARTDPLGRIHELSIARVLAEAAFDTHAAASDPDRDALIAWLTRERTKFLMSTIADAARELDSRLALAASRRHEQRPLAAAVAREVVIELLAAFWTRLRAESEPRLAVVAKRIIDALDRSIGDLASTVPFDTLAHVEPIRGFRRDLDVPANSNTLATLIGFVGLGGRRRADASARDELVAMLHDSSLRLTTRVLEEYDTRSLLLEERLCDLIDSSIESARVAANFADEARSGGPDQVARARARIESWSGRLAAIHDRLL